VNASFGAQAQFHGEPIDVVLGGYHLSGTAMETRIDATVRDLKERIRPRVVAPGHCTGWRAAAALAHAFAPERYGPSAVGTMYTLRAPLIRRGAARRPGRVPTARTTTRAGTRWHTRAMRRSARPTARRRARRSSAWPPSAPARWPRGSRGSTARAR